MIVLLISHIIWLLYEATSPNPIWNNEAQLISVQNMPFILLIENYYECYTKLLLVCVDIIQMASGVHELQMTLTSDLIYSLNVNNWHW